MSIIKPKTKNEIKQSWGISLPLIASNIVQASSGFVGTLMLAHLGNDVLAAAALGAAVYVTLIVFLFGILGSVGILVAQNYGAKNKKGIQLAVSQGLRLGIIISVLMMIANWFSPIIYRIAGQNPHVVQLATTYVHAVTWCFFPLIFLIVLEFLYYSFLHINIDLEPHQIFFKGFLFF